MRVSPAVPPSLITICTTVAVICLGLVAGQMVWADDEDDPGKFAFLSLVSGSAGIKTLSLDNECSSSFSSSPRNDAVISGGTRRLSTDQSIYGCAPRVARTRTLIRILFGRLDRLTVNTRFVSRLVSNKHVFSAPTRCSSGTSTSSGCCSAQTLLRTRPAAYVGGRSDTSVVTDSVSNQ